MWYNLIVGWAVYVCRHTGLSALEMDTVKGVREQGKRLLTMIFQDNSVMLLFLMPDGTGASVKRIFDYLERGLGLERFQRLFPVILTDNGICIQSFPPIYVA